MRRWLPVVLALAACRPHPAAVPDAGGGLQAQSDAVLGRAPTTGHAQVKEILISWGALAPEFRGHLDPRALPRSEPDAEALVQELLRRAAAGDSFDKLAADYSEDPSGPSRTYDIFPNGASPPPFQAVSLRLKVGEVGTVRSRWGWHVVQRIQ